MLPETVYLPIDIDSGPYCPPTCVGNWSRRTVCAVFWEDLHKARHPQGKPMRNTTGYLYKKCGACLQAVKNSPPEKGKTIAVKWRPPPDIFRSE